MDINAVRTLLRMNSLAEDADETAIRSALAQASYSLEEIDTALALLRGEGTSSVSTSSASRVSGTSTPSFDAKKPFRRFGFMPQRWLSIHGLIFALILYFLVLPIGGFMLVWGLFALAAVPVIGMVALYGAIALMYVGHFTGTNMIVDAYQYAGHWVVAEVMNARLAPYSIMEIPCEEGFVFTIAGEQVIRVERPYPSIGYSLMKETKGTLIIETPSEKVSIPLVEYGEVKSPELRSDLPFGAPEDLYIFKDFDALSNRMGLSNMLDGVSGFGTGEAGEGAKVVALDASRVSADEFNTLTACIAEDEKQNGLVHNRSSLLRDLFGVGRIMHASAPAWGSEETIFACTNKLSVELTFPSYLSVRHESYGEMRISRIGVVNRDLSTRSLTLSELRRLSPTLWWDDYLAYRSCVEEDQCSTGQRGYDPDTGAPLIVGYTPFSSLSPGNQNFNVLILNTKRKSFEAIGIADGIPSTFNSCLNPKGQNIKQYLESLISIAK